MKAYFNIGQSIEKYHEILSKALSLDYGWTNNKTDPLHCQDSRVLIRFSKGEEVCLIFNFKLKIIQYSEILYLLSYTDIYFEIKKESSLINWLKTGKEKVRIG